MKLRSTPLLLATALVVGACTGMPSEPSVTVLPGSHKTFDQFLIDDHNCRQFALAQLSGVNAKQASGTAASSPTVATSTSGDSGYSAQHRYDAAYIQCMYASGHRVPIYGQTLAAPPATPPANYKPYSPPPAPQ